MLLCKLSIIQWIVANWKGKWNKIVINGDKTKSYLGMGSLDWFPNWIGVAIFVASSPHFGETYQLYAFAGFTQSRSFTQSTQFSVFIVFMPLLHGWKSSRNNLRVYLIILTLINFFFLWKIAGSTYWSWIFMLVCVVVKTSSKITKNPFKKKTEPKNFCIRKILGMSNTLFLPFILSKFFALQHISMNAFNIHIIWVENWKKLETIWKTLKKFE